MLGRVFQLEILVPATRVAYEADLLFPPTALRKNALTFCFSVADQGKKVDFVAVTARISPFSQHDFQSCSDSESRRRKWNCAARGAFGVWLSKSPVKPVRPLI